MIGMFCFSSMIFNTSAIICIFINALNNLEHFLVFLEKGKFCYLVTTPPAPEMSTLSGLSTKKTKFTLLFGIIYIYNLSLKEYSLKSTDTFKKDGKLGCRAVFLKYQTME